MLLTRSQMAAILMDSFFAQPYHDDQDEPAADPLPPHFFDFDNTAPDQLSRSTLKGESCAGVKTRHGG